MNENTFFTHIYIYSNFKEFFICRITIRQKGLFVIAEVPALRLSLKWDKGTRIYVKAGPMWKGLVIHLFNYFLNIAICYKYHQFE